jgi:hypothetical protein
MCQRCVGMAKVCDQYQEEIIPGGSPVILPIIMKKDRYVFNKFIQ